MARCSGCGFEGEETERPGMGGVCAARDTRADALYCDDCLERRDATVGMPTAGEIEALRREAGEAGDLEMVRICDAAVEGDVGAKAEVLRVIGAARAMESE